MNQSTFNEAVKALKSGAPDSAIKIIRPLLENREKRGDCLALIGACYEKKKQYPEAVYFFRKAVELEPQKNNYSIAFERVQNKARSLIDEVRVTKTGGKFIVMIIIFAVITGAFFALSFVPSVIEFPMALMDIDNFSEMQISAALMIAGSVFGFVFAVLLIVWSVKRIIYGVRLKNAKGPNFDGRKYEPCRVCELPFLKKENDCPWCGSPRYVEPEQPEEESVHASPAAGGVNAGGGGGEAEPAPAGIPETVTCGNCGINVNVPPGAGDVIACTNCGEPVQVPIQSAPAIQPSPQQPAVQQQVDGQNITVSIDGGSGAKSGYIGPKNVSIILLILLGVLGNGVRYIYLGQTTKGVVFMMIDYLIMAPLVIFTCGMGIIITAPYSLILFIDSLVLASRIKRRSIHPWRFF